LKSEKLETRKLKRQLRAEVPAEESDDPDGDSESDEDARPVKIRKVRPIKKRQSETNRKTKKFSNPKKSGKNKKLSKSKVGRVNPLDV